MGAAPLWVKALALLRLFTWTRNNFQFNFIIIANNNNWCWLSNFYSVYLPTGSSNFEGLTIPFLLYHRSFLPFLSTFSAVAYVGKSSCNRLMGMLQYRSVVAICLWPSSSRTNAIFPFVCNRLIQVKVCRKLWKHNGVTTSLGQTKER